MGITQGKQMYKQEKNNHFFQAVFKEEVFPRLIHTNHNFSALQISLYRAIF